MHVLFVILGCTLVICGDCIQLSLGGARTRYRRLPSDDTTVRPNVLRNRMMNRIMRHRERNVARVCYDTVGCFEVPHSRSPLQKTPESPSTLDTKFYLFRRNVNFSEPEVIYYDDNGTSLSTSKFDYKQPLKIYIHGYMSNWNQKIAFVAADGYLKLSDCNFLAMDWSKGARGPQYTTAAANTEIVGRQLGILLLSMMKKGLNPNDIHIIGFSLGAHVAGCAAELVKMHGKLVGRITGLDPAGPLFRHSHLRERSKKLDKSDARFVDVLHTDSSPVFVDGYGLWEPIGHVDFFANGGKEQPGCTDPQASVVLSSIERTLTIDKACSHIRAPRLFFESLLAKSTGGGCEFVAYTCPGGFPSFERGQCFPQPGDRKRDALGGGRMGEEVAGEGTMYFVTRGKAPYCGSQLQAIVSISPITENTRGMLFLVLQHGGKTTTFKIQCEIQGASTGIRVHVLGAAEYKSLEANLSTISAYLTYYSYENADQNNTTPSAKAIFVDKIRIRDMRSNSWYYCRKDTMVGGKDEQHQKTTSLKLSQQKC